MGYYDQREKRRVLFESYRDKHYNKIKEAEARAAELAYIYPEIGEIDRKIAEAGPRIFRAGMAGENVEKKVSEIRREVEMLRKKREDMLSSLGYGAGYTDPKWDCNICEDTGYTDEGMCRCFRSQIAKIAIDSCGVGTLGEKCSFENFSLSYHEDDKEAMHSMEHNFSYIKDYGKAFKGKGGESLLLIGGTGLGKTHLCAALAVTAAKKGCDVIYTTAQNMFSIFEDEHFRSYGRDREGTERFLSCELLIVDDLGTEMNTQFTVSCLYNIINSRMIADLPTVINTNLAPRELSSRYTDRVTSRLFGEFTPLVFKGGDVRMKKLKMGN